jgi:hypothetical protein
MVCQILGFVLRKILNMRLEVLGMAGALPCGGVSVIPWFLGLPERDHGLRLRIPSPLLAWRVNFDAASPT